MKFGSSGQIRKAGDVISIQRYVYFDAVVDVRRGWISYVVLDFDKAWSLDDKLLRLPLKAFNFPKEHAIFFWCGQRKRGPKETCAPRDCPATPPECHPAACHDVFDR
jgi:hypothetical protein